jgi:hypothetical protein
MLVGYIAFEPSDRRQAHHPIFFLLLSTALMIMTARWKRIAEYWPPFAVLFAGFSLQPWFVGFRPYLTRLPAAVLEELKPFLDREVPRPPPPRTGEEMDLRAWFRMIGASAVALILGAFLFVNLSSTIKLIGDSEPHDYYAAGAAWLRANVPPGQIIFNTDWDDFPRLFYYDSTHNYVSGLDPSYLHEKDPGLSSLYDRITLGKEEDPGPLIRQRFGARYVFSDNDHHDFLEHASSSGWFDIVYEDKQCIILYIRDEKIGPLVDDPFEVPDND